MAISNYNLFADTDRYNVMIPGYLVLLDVVGRDEAIFFSVVLNEPPVRIFRVVNHCETFTDVESQSVWTVALKCIYGTIHF